MIVQEALSIPGQIEGIEIESLYSILKDIPLSPGDCVVEFGTYYGRSTYCIAKGLLSNSLFNATNKFFAFDIFESSIDGVMAPYILADAKRYEVSDLLQISEKTINFKKAFMFYMQKLNIDHVVTPVAAKLHSSAIPDDLPIAAIHVDSPQFYSEFKPILYRFLPNLKPDGTIIFQDYFLQWSATLIATINYLIDQGYLLPVASAASSLICKKAKDIPKGFLLELDVKMDRPSFVISEISRSEGLLQELDLDRPEQFMPRIALAKIQYLFDTKDYREAASAFHALVLSGISNATLADFLNLFAEGFTMRNQYDADERL